MLRCFQQIQIPYLVVANKVDKLKKSQWASAQTQISQTLEIPEEEILLHSAETAIGRDALIQKILSAMDKGKDERKDDRVSFE